MGYDENIGISEFDLPNLMVSTFLMENQNYARLLRWIREKRKEKDITQSEMAQALDLPQKTYSMIETNKRGLHTSELMIILEKFDLDFFDLLGKADKENQLKDALKQINEISKNALDDEPTA
jgi:transcriptional regulator with XRE-family HTH domain